MLISYRKKKKNIGAGYGCQEKLLEYYRIVN